MSSPAVLQLAHQEATSVANSAFMSLSSANLQHQAQFFFFTLARCKASSPECCRWWGWGPALPLLWPQGQLFLCRRLQGGASFLQSLQHLTDKEGRASSPAPTSSEPALLCPTSNSVSSMLLSWRGAGPALLNTAAGKGQGQPVLLSWPQDQWSHQPQVASVPGRDLSLTTLLWQVKGGARSSLQKSDTLLILY